jgi:acyl carrier protein
MYTAPDYEEILERLRRVVPEKVDVAPELLQPDAQLVDIGIDSFSLIELVFVAEEEFRVKIPFEGLKVKTVGDVIEVIERRIRESAI